MYVNIGLKNMKSQVLYLFELFLSGIKSLRYEKLTYLSLIILSFVNYITCIANSKVPTYNRIII